MELDFEKMGLTFFDEGANEKVVKEIIEIVLPALKGRTINQIEKALQECLYLVKDSLIVKEAQNH